MVAIHLCCFWGYFSTTCQINTFIFVHHNVQRARANVKLLSAVSGFKKYSINDCLHDSNVSFYTSQQKWDNQVYYDQIARFDYSVV